MVDAREEKPHLDESDQPEHLERNLRDKVADLRQENKVQKTIETGVLNSEARFFIKSSWSISTLHSVNGAQAQKYLKGQEQVWIHN